MILVRNRTDTRWAPARFRYGLFRLIAFLVATRLREAPKSGIVTVIDRDQNAIESYAIATWMVVTVSAFIAGRFDDGLAILVFLFAVPISMFGVHASMLALGAVIRLLPGRSERDNTRPVSIIIFAALAVSAAFVATSELWSRHIARLFLLVLIVNGIAALIVRVLRGKIAEVNVARGVPG